MEAPDVLRQAGCPHPTKSEFQEITIAENQRAEFDRLEAEMRQWRAQRETELERIRRRRAERRGEEYIPTINPSLMDLGLDGEDTNEARVDMTLPPDSPSGASDGSSPSPSRPRKSSTDNDHILGTEDGPLRLPIDTFGDIPTWEPTSKFDNATDTVELDEKFATVLKDQGIDLGLGGVVPVTMGDTFGRKASGTGNGLEVITEDR